MNLSCKWDNQIKWIVWFFFTLCHLFNLWSLNNHSPNTLLLNAAQMLLLRSLAGKCVASLFALKHFHVICNSIFKTCFCPLFSFVWISSVHRERANCNKSTLQSSNLKLYWFNNSQAKKHVCAWVYKWRDHVLEINVKN